MKEKGEVDWSLISTVMVAVGVILSGAYGIRAVCLKVGYEKGYVQACKDFYQGELKYALVENKDGTREWKRKEK